jgi:hypothetical protein
VTEPLTPEELATMEQAARRYQGAWTGTSGTLAAHVMRLIQEVRRLQVEAAYRRELRRPMPPLNHDDRAAG